MPARNRACAIDSACLLPSGQSQVDQCAIAKDADIGMTNFHKRLTAANLMVAAAISLPSLAPLDAAAAKWK